MTTTPQPDRRHPRSAGDRRRDPRTDIAVEADAAQAARDEQQARAGQRLADAGLIAEHGVTTQVLLAGLAASANDLAAVAKDLYRASVLSRAERAVLLAILVVNLLIGGVVAYGVWRLNGLADTNRALGEVNRTSSQTIVDCTRPGGVCYERAQQQTAAAVASLNLVTIAATECADAYDGAALHDCILRRVKAGR